MTDMIRDIQTQNIRLKSYAVGNHKTVCPRCSHTRRNKTDTCLSVTVKDGGSAVWNCHHCFWKGAAGNVAGKRDAAPVRKEYKKPAPVNPDSSLPAHVMQYLAGRCITEAVIKKNRLYWDPRREAICFPYFEKGELVNVKYRTLNKRWGMEAGAKLVLYGIDDARGQDTIVVVEGEFDQLALQVCGITNAVSVPNGAPARIREGEPQNTGQFEYLQSAEDIFKNAKRVVLAVDNDPAGNNLKFELARRIGLHKCFVATFPTKDANDCLKEFGVDLTLECLRDAKPYPIKGLYEVEDFTGTLDDFFNNRMRAGSPTGWENLDKLYTVMDGELTIVTGAPGAGKSEIINALMVNLAKSENKRFVVFSPEDSKEQLTAKLIEKIIELPTHPSSTRRMTLDQFRGGAEWVAKYFYFIVNDDGEDLPTVEWILEKAAAAVYRYGVKGLVIDPYNELEHRRSANFNETEYVSLMLSKLKRFAKTHMLHIWLVAHPAKLQSDRDGVTRVPTLYDISGSAHFINKPDNGIVIHRAEDAADQTEVHVRKIRQKHVGRRGKCILLYDKDTGKYRVPPDAVNKMYDKYMDEPDMVTHDA